MQLQEQKIKYCAYVRKSSEDSEKQALSIPAQIDQVREKFGDLDIVGIFSESKSAFKPNNRPEFQRMIDLIDSGKANGIIAWHPDRISRNEIDAATVTYMIRTGKLKDLKFGSYTFDNSPEGMMMLQIVMSQSQYFSSKLGKDVKRGMEKKAKMGWFNHVAPAGYRNVHNNDTGINYIDKDPILFPIVRKLWDTMLTGNYTAAKVLKMANEEWGYRTRKHRNMGGKPLSYSGIYKILNNTFYYGFYEYPAKSGNFIQGAHEPMISKEEYDRVQAMFKKVHVAKPHYREFAFTGCINCGDCGCLITAETKTKFIKSTKENKYYTYYHCTHRKKDYDCQQHGVTKEESLTEQIERLILNITILPQFKDWAIEALESNQFEQGVSDKAIKSTQETSLKEAEQHLDNLTRMRYKEQIAEEPFLKEKAHLMATIAKLKSDATKPVDEEKPLRLAKETFEFAVSAHTQFMNGDLRKKREIFNYLGSDWKLKDGILNGCIAPYLQPFEREYKRLEKQYLRLEPTKGIANKTKSTTFEVMRFAWLSSRVTVSVFKGFLETLRCSCRHSGHRFQRPR